MKTIRQIADELGIDKQRVYRHIKKNHISEAYQKNGVMYYDEVEETAIKQWFSKDSVHQNHITNTTNNTVNETAIGLLKEELKIKNEQIEKLQKLLDQEQQLRMVAEKRALLTEEQNMKQIEKLEDKELLLEQSEKELSEKNNQVHILEKKVKHAEAEAASYHKTIFGLYWKSDIPEEALVVFRNAEKLPEEVKKVL